MGGILREGEETITLDVLEKIKLRVADPATLFVGRPVDPRLVAAGQTDKGSRHVPRPLACLFERGGGGNMGINAGLFRDMQFDEAFVGGFGWEETELAVRVYQAGGVVHYLPRARVVHQWHPRGKQHWGDLRRNAKLFRDRTGLFTGQKPDVHEGGSA